MVLAQLSRRRSKGSPAEYASAEGFSSPRIGHEIPNPLACRTHRTMQKLEPAPAVEHSQVVKTLVRGWQGFQRSLVAQIDRKSIFVVTIVDVQFCLAEAANRLLGISLS